MLIDLIYCLYHIIMLFKENIDKNFIAVPGHKWDFQIGSICAANLTIQYFVKPWFIIRPCEGKLIIRQTQGLVKIMA